MLFEEVRTAGVVAQELERLGFKVATGIAKTGVVGTLTNGTSRRTIGIRADMDALPIQEQTNLPYASKFPGKMHACGHDGHTTMLLGLARYLAETKHFDGTVHLIFQPSEEDEGGALRMIEDGLFTRFPCDAVYALHNLPGEEFGTDPGQARPDHGGGRHRGHHRARRRRPWRGAAQGQSIPSSRRRALSWRCRPSSRAISIRMTRRSSPSAPSMAARWRPSFRKR